MDSVKHFNQELSSLYEIKPPISKAKMTAVTKGAIKAIKYYKHVVQSVEKFIQKCRPEYKIPGLYVIDSIVRQSRHQFGASKDLFAPRFAKNVQITFYHLYKCSEEEKSKVIRVLNLWQKNEVFTADVIQPLFDLANPSSDLHRQIEEQIKRGDKNLGGSIKVGGVGAGPGSIQVVPDAHSHHDQDAADHQLILTLQQLLKNHTGGGDGVKFNKKLLDFDYSDEEDGPGGDGEPTPQMLEALQNILSNEVLLNKLKQMGQITNHQIQQLQQLLPSAQAAYQQPSQGFFGSNPNVQLPSSNDHQMQQQPQHHYDLWGGPGGGAFQTQQPPVQHGGVFSSGGPLGGLGGPTADAEDEIQIVDDRRGARDRDRDRRDRSRSRSRDRSGKRSRHRSRSRDRSSRRRRSRSRDREEKDRDREKRREREKKGLPPIKKNHLSVCSTTLWVGHLSKLVADEDLSDLFGEYGVVESINLIPPRGCAFVHMNRRMDAYKALKELHKTKLQGKPITIAWAPGKGMKEPKWKDYWDVSLGVSYIPIEKLDAQTDLVSLEDGGAFDEETMPEWMKNARETAANQQHPAAAAGATVIPGFIPVTSEATPLGLQVAPGVDPAVAAAHGMALPPGAMPPFGLPPGIPPPGAGILPPPGPGGLLPPPNAAGNPGLLGAPVGLLPPRFAPPPGFPPPAFDASQPPPGMRLPFPPPGAGGTPAGPHSVANVEGQGDVEMEIEDNNSEDGGAGGGGGANKRGGRDGDRGNRPSRWNRNANNENSDNMDQGGPPLASRLRNLAEGMGHHHNKDGPRSLLDMPVGQPPDGWNENGPGDRDNMPPFNDGPGLGGPPFGFNDGGPPNPGGFGEPGPFNNGGMRPPFGHPDGGPPPGRGGFNDGFSDGPPGPFGPPRGRGGWRGRGGGRGGFRDGPSQGIWMDDGPGPGGPPMGPGGGPPPMFGGNGGPPIDRDGWDQPPWGSGGRGRGRGGGPRGGGRGGFDNNDFGDRDRPPWGGNNRDGPVGGGGFGDRGGFPDRDRRDNNNRDRRDRDRDSRERSSERTTERGRSSRREGRKSRWGNEDDAEKVDPDLLTHQQAMGDEVIKKAQEAIAKLQSGGVNAEATETVEVAETPSTPPPEQEEQDNAQQEATEQQCVENITAEESAEVHHDVENVVSHPEEEQQHDQQGYPEEESEAVEMERNETSESGQPIQEAEPDFQQQQPQENVPEEAVAEGETDQGYGGDVQQEQSHHEEYQQPNEPVQEVEEASYAQESVNLSSAPLEEAPPQNQDDQHVYQQQEVQDQNSAPEAINNESDQVVFEEPSDVGKLNQLEEEDTGVAVEAETDDNNCEADTVAVGGGDA